MSMALLRAVAELFAPAFQDNMNWLLGSENVRGLHLEFDRYWYARMAATQEVVIMPDGRLWRHTGWFWNPPKDLKKEKDFADSLRRWIHEGLGVRGLEEWALRCRSMGYAPNSIPVVFRVILRSEEPGGALKELPRSFEGFPIIYEVRPPAIGLATSPVIVASDNVGRATPAISGTAGGFLQDPSSRTTYLLSCAHVLGTVGDSVMLPGGVSRSSAVSVGKVVRSVLPPPNPPNTSCSARSYPTSENLDMALAELDQTIQPDPNVRGIGKPTFITPVLQMNQGDQVSLVGERSGRVDAEIDSLTIFHEIDIDAQPRCFGNIYSLCAPRPWYVNTKLVKSGDSGSWILRRTSTMIGWDGMLLAGDGAHAYACFAEDAYDDLTSNVSQNLILYP